MQKIFTKTQIFTKIFEKLKKVKSQVGENEIKFPKWKIISKKKIRKCFLQKNWLGLKSKIKQKLFWKVEKFLKKFAR